MEHEVTKKTHKIMDRPVLSTILIIIFVLVLSSVVQSVKFLIPGMAASENRQYFSDIIAAFLVLLILEFIFTKMWFGGEFEGTLKGDIVYGLRLLIPAAVVDVLLFLYDRIMGSGSLNNVLMVLSVSVVAGIVEEITFRSLILSNLMRIMDTYKGMLCAVAASSLIFGFIHFSNLVLGADMSATISQFFSATCMGLFFSAVYLTCGSIVPLMLYHFGHDVFALLFLGLNEYGATTEASTSTSTIENVILDIVLVVMVVILLKPDKYEKIRRIWDEKWGLEKIEEGAVEGA